MNQPVIEVPAEILLVDDDEGDVRLTQEALNRSRLRTHMNVANDGLEALDYLRQRGRFPDAPLPDLILLDLNMPRMDGRELLSIIKGDEDLRRIPVVVLTTSDQDEDVLRTYELHANCYITKPVDLAKFTHIVQSIDHFWFTLVKLPPHP